LMQKIVNEMASSRGKSGMKLYVFGRNAVSRLPTGGRWNRGSRNRGTKLQGWKSREWKSWHQKAGGEKRGRNEYEKPKFPVIFISNNAFIIFRRK